MIHLVFFVLIMVYFLSGTHQKVLTHFGLTDRDDHLLWIGFLVSGLFSSSVGFIAGLFVGQFLWISLIFIALYVFLINMQYGRL